MSGWYYTYSYSNGDCSTVEQPFNVIANALDVCIQYGPTTYFYLTCANNACSRTLYSGTGCNANSAPVTEPMDLGCVSAGASYSYYYGYTTNANIQNGVLPTGGAQYATALYTSDVTCTSLYQRLDADIINSCIADSTASSFKVTYPTKYNWQSTASCTGSYNSTNTYPSNCVMVAGSNPALYGNSEVILTPAFAPTSAPISNSNDDDASLKGGEIAAVVICLLIFAGVCFGLGYYCFYRRQKKDALLNNEVSAGTQMRGSENRSNAF